MIVRDLDIDRAGGPCGPFEAIRHWSLIRMLYWPARWPLKASSRFPPMAQIAARSCKLVASSRSSRVSACRAKPENSLTCSPAAKRSVFLSLSDVESAVHALAGDRRKSGPSHHHPVVRSRTHRTDCRLLIFGPLLARETDWAFLERTFVAAYRDGPGQPPLPTRLTTSRTRRCASAGCAPLPTKTIAATTRRSITSSGSSLQVSGRA
jgi:hypothetical protein